MSATGDVETPSRPADGCLPPVAAWAVATMVLVVIGGVYLAAYLPRHPPLAPAIAVLVGAVLTLAFNVAQLSRVRDFSWSTFFLVGKWTLLAYVVIAGMLEYVFVLDHTPGTLLFLLTMMLVIYAVDIPLLLAFSVARYQPPDPRPGP